MKLTKEEKRWIEELQNVLSSCPSKRIGFYTIGDAQVSIYDRRKEDKINDIMDHSSKDFGACVDEAGAEVDPLYATIDFPAPVHSMAG